MVPALEVDPGGVRPPESNRQKRGTDSKAARYLGTGRCNDDPNTGSFGYEHQDALPGRTRNLTER
jgi:hypothetical protein